MAKAAAGKPVVKSVHNKHLHARVAFLHQAATHLALQQTPKASATSSNASDAGLRNHGLPLLLASQLKAVSLKAQIRLSRDMKRSLCKVCNIPLLPGTTSETRMENPSKGAKKPWADVLVVRCSNCKTEKRFPVGACRQKKKTERDAAVQISHPETTQNT